MATAVILKGDADVLNDLSCGSGNGDGEKKCTVVRYLGGKTKGAWSYIRYGGGGTIGYQVCSLPFPLVELDK